MTPEEHMVIANYVASLLQKYHESVVLPELEKMRQSQITCFELLRELGEITALEKKP